MGCGCDGPGVAQTVDDMDPVTGKRVIDLNLLERLEYSHRVQARAILESMDAPEEKRRRMTELDDWLERTKQSPSYSV